MSSAASQQQATWLVENGPRELEALLRAIVYHPSAPVLIADNDRHYFGRKLRSRETARTSARKTIIGHSLDDFADPSFRPQMSDLWQPFWNGESKKARSAWLVPTASPPEMEYTVKGNILPVRHLLSAPRQAPAEAKDNAATLPTFLPGCRITPYFFECGRQVVAWYSGAERIYGYAGAEAMANTHMPCSIPPKKRGAHARVRRRTETVALSRAISATKAGA